MARPAEADLLARENVSVTMAAQYMGVAKSVLSVAIQKNRMPFAFAVKRGEKWSYVIPPKRLIAWYTGEDMKKAAHEQDS